MLHLKAGHAVQQPTAPKVFVLSTKRQVSDAMQDLVLPDRQNTRAVGQPSSPEIFHFTEIRKSRMCFASRPYEEGRIAIVTNAGRVAVDVGHIGAKDFAGRATVSEAPGAHDRCDRRTAKSCGPGARSLCVKSCSDGCCPTGHAHQSSTRRRGQ